MTKQGYILLYIVYSMLSLFGLFFAVASHSYFWTGWNLGFGYYFTHRLLVVLGDDNAPYSDK